jgi:spermidine synthase
VKKKEVVRIYDEYGPIQVFDDGNKHFLMFGNNDEQGCILKSDPGHIQYEYVRAMLVPFLFTDVAPRCLLLGLGAGSLAHCLHSRKLAHTIDVVELRKSVIEIVYAQFQLPKTETIQVIHDDAGRYLSQPNSQPYDMIFSDIYNEQGMDLQQAQTRYISNCQANLSTDGWLVLNLWRDHKKLDLLSVLEELFDTILTVNIGNENWIVLATDASIDVNKKYLKLVLKTLNERLGFSMSKIAKNMTHFKNGEA